MCYALEMFFETSAKPVLVLCHVKIPGIDLVRLSWSLEVASSRYSISLDIRSKKAVSAQLSYLDYSRILEI